MTRNEIITALKKFFKVEELVCNHIYARWYEASWQFLDTNYLHALLIIRRDILKSPMICNFSTARQRGMRCNRCEIVRNKSQLYLSSHLLGQAGDFTVKNMPAETARLLIKNNERLLPCNIRLENNVSWLHIDTLPQYGVNDKVYDF